MKQQARPEEWLGHLLYALTKSDSVQAASRPEDITLDEKTVTLRVDLKSYNGLSIGDYCKFPRGAQRWFGKTLPVKDNRHEDMAIMEGCTIAGFFEVSGRIKKSKCIVIIIMCAIVRGYQPGIFDAAWSSVIRKSPSQGGLITEPILLYLPENLSKFSEES